MLFDSLAPAHLAPEGLPSALSRTATLAAWVPFGPTFGCSFSKTPSLFGCVLCGYFMLDSGSTAKQPPFNELITQLEGMASVPSHFRRHSLIRNFFVNFLVIDSRKS